MDRVSELMVILGQNLPMNKARLDCFGRMLVALFKVRTINLSEIAVAFKSKAGVGSRYKRILRFFSGAKVDFPLVAKWIFKLFVSDKKIYLAIDRTNWYWGKGKINMLTLAIAYEGMAIPILWTFMNKAGNAKASEHRAIINRFVKLFGTACIAGVLGDREFASGDLFKWLNKKKIPFYIRIKEDSLVRIKGKEIYKAKKIFRNLKLKEKSVFQIDIELYDAKVYLAGSRSERGELMIVATNQKPQNAIAIYLRRWEIETLFSCLKGRGFRFEDTHVTKLDRLEKIMALLAVGVAWAHKIGEWRAEIKPIRFGQHRDSRRPQNSYFRYGFDYVREILFNFVGKTHDFRHCLRVLAPPKSLAEAKS